ncbi:acetyl-CoA synthetase [Thermonema lapsum]|uniref:Acetyl-CoA synthetase n=1 Tax=Thermonema lapsum TaxID=28195 RepID=A0A846MNI1_9BACT|nr:acetyl-CoA synthetase [Thermonema lapsum]
MMNFRIKSFEEYQSTYRRSVEDPEGFWNEIAGEYHWFAPWQKTLEWEFDTPSVKWFLGGKTNITYNCLDRHLESHAGKTAIIWEPNDPDEAPLRLTYRELYEQVCRFANVLKRNGIQKGDRVAIYMPMIPELAIAVLACARIGAVHSVVFAGFSASALADRIKDAQAVAVITSDGMKRGAKEMPVKAVVDEAIAMGCDSVKRVIVANRLGQEVNMQEGRDVWLHEELKQVSDECPAVPMDSEDMLFILYTSGSTGKPKGVVHTVGGYMVYAGYTFLNVFQYKEGEVYWCTADIGWITGHTYLVYGPLLNGATTLMFEGVPTYPDAGRFWQVVDKHQVNILLHSAHGYSRAYVCRLGLCAPLFA